MNLEDMISFIAKSNGIAKFNLVIYEQLPTKFVYHETDTEEGIKSSFAIDAANLSEELKLASMAAKEEDCLVGICSNVLRNASEAQDKYLNSHLFLLDFKCPPSKENLKMVSYFVKRVGLKSGYILNSGNSYHFYYSGLFDADGWYRKMWKVLMTHKRRALLDMDWVAIQEERYYSILRLSTNTAKTKLPEIVKVLK